MNSLRSPAPASNLFNVGGLANTRNNSRIVNAMNVATNSISNAANTAVNSLSNVANTAANSLSNATNTFTNSTSNVMKKGPSASLILLIGFFVVIFAVAAVFWREIRDGFNVMYDRIRVVFGATPVPPSNDEHTETVNEKPEAPQDNTVHETRMVEKILPGRQQVFNISKNSYTYYDAEPLCKALGAELATYEQVKQAFAGGADWCNYGWVKGQMAVYPTQKNTWEELQAGPEAQRGACGQPGVNGGFFDNPELRFGVSCYGVKPGQKDHDATSIASGEGAPLSPGALEFDKKVQKYRGESDHIAILPYNKSAWSS
jgi:hypothetical protein